MRTIIHDLKDKDLNKIKFYDDDVVISSREITRYCVGCFSCWIRHPKKCIFRDELIDIVENIKNSDDFVIISECRYGCYSASTKRVLERCIGYVLPYFTIRNNEIHHKSRYDKKINFTTYFYGDISKEDKMCLDKLVKANAINLNAKDYKVKCFKNVKELCKCIH